MDNIKAWLAKNKWLAAFIAAAVLLVAAIIVAIVVGVNANNTPNLPGIPTEEGPETGLYYYDTAAGEYTLSLHGGNKFTINGPGYNKSGEYVVNGNDITLDFFRDEDGTATAVIDGSTLTLTVGDNVSKYLLQKPFTVAFDTQGGSSVESYTVINGKTAYAPADPTKDGHVFLGWYSDSALTVPYAFSQNAVSSDITLYAKWAKAQDGINEYLVDFELGFDTEGMEAIRTVGGKLVFDSNYVDPVREGYTFGGWYVSMTENGDKLSYKAYEGMTVAANTTLFAVWNNNSDAIAAPDVSVDATSIKWSAGGVNVSYTVKITESATGKVIFDGSVVGAANKAFDFASEAAGEYKIEVTATKGTDSVTATRYYTNRALDRVSSFEVVDGKVLVFGAVAGAERYYITVECGNSEHNHSYVSNGTSTVYNFAGCSMQETGIKFTVTASAEGYAASVSETYVYVRNLDKIGAIAYDDATESFTWARVPGAAKYVVTVKVGDNTYVYDNGTLTSFAVSAYSGEIKVSVLPVTEGYNSPAATEASVTKVTLATPSGLTVNNTTVSWNATEGAESYVVKVNGISFTVTETSFSLINDSIVLKAGDNYAITVQAVSTASGVKSSLESKPINAKYLAMSDNVKYGKNTVSWNPVIGATGYEVSINGGEPIAVTDATSLEIVLTKAGVNTIGVRTANLSDTAWKTIEVYAYEVNYISRTLNGSDVTEYLAVGDKMLLPGEFTLTGYDFTGWYNAPYAAESNGAAYTGDTFVGNGAITLYANWTPKDYSVRLVGLDDTVTNLENDQTYTVTYSKGYVIPVPVSTDPTKEVFLGWYTGPNGVGTQLTDEKGKSIVNYEFTRDSVAYPLYEDGLLEYTIQADGTYAVSKGVNISKATVVNIPASYKGISVTVVLENAFAYCDNIVTINIPDTVKLIGTSAFNTCRGLTDINIVEIDGNHEKIYSSSDGALLKKDIDTIYLEVMPRGKTGSYVVPEGVDSIRMKAFLYTRLTSVEISKDVTYVATDAFFQSSKLQTVIFKEGGDQPLLFEPDAFSDCLNVKSITFPARLSEFDYLGLDVLPSLETVNVEAEGVNYSSIDGLLCDSTGETILYAPKTYRAELTVPMGVRAIAEGAFEGRLGITSVVIPAYVNEIGYRAFAGCNNIASVTVNGGRSNELIIGSEAFAECARIDTFSVLGNDKGTMDAGSVCIEPYAFTLNTGMKTFSVAAGATVSYVGEGAFLGNEKLASINVADGAAIYAIGPSAFAECVSLRTLTIHSTTTEIGDGAFSACSALSDISFAPGGDEINFGGYVFADCTSLRTINLPSTIGQFNGSAFDGCESITEIVVDPANTTLKAVDGVLYNYDLTEIKFYPMGKGGDLTNLPWDTLTSLGDTVFKGNVKLTSVTLTDKITNIGESAFEGCLNLESVTFADNGTALTVGDSAFSGCIELATIALPTYTTSIGAYSFYKVPVKSITLPAAITEIPDYAFAYSGLESFTVPANVTYIGEGAFLNATHLAALTIESGDKELAISTSTAVDGAFKGTMIQSVVIPARVTIIGAEAFRGVSALTSVTFDAGSKLTEISKNALRETGITEIALPVGLEIIGANSFYKAKLESVVIPATVTVVSDYAFGNTPLTSVTFTEGGTAPLSIGMYSFRNTSFEEITFPARLRELYTVSDVYGMQIKSVEQVFTGNNVLKAIHVNANNTVFGSVDGVLYEKDSDGNPSVLVYCPRAKTGTVTVPNTVVLVDNLAFSGVKVSEIVFEEFATTDANYGKPSLVLGTENVVYNITISQSKYTPYAVFGNTSSIKTIKLPAHLSAAKTVSFANLSGAVELVFNSAASPVEFGSYSVIANSGLGELALPALKEVGRYAFASNKSLSEVTVADGSTVTEYEGDAFRYCNALTTVEIAASAESIGSYIFFECYELDNIIFEGENLKHIGDYAFRYAGFSSFKMPDSVVQVGASLFMDCSNLTSVELSENLRTTIAIEDTAYGQQVSAFNGASHLVEIIVPERNPYLKSVDGVLYDKELTIVFNYPAAKDATEYVIPDTVVSIEIGAFNYFTGKSLVLPEGVESIAKSAFSLSDIEEIYLPSTLRTIGTQAFSMCQNLRVVEIAPNCVLESIGREAFRYCAFEEFDIPDNVSFIGDGAFDCCLQLKKLTLPAAITEIPEDAFKATVSLKELAIQEGVTKILPSAFFSSGVVNLSLPSTLVGIDKNAFSNCMSLETVNIAPFSNLQYIADTVFDYCVALVSIELPDSLTTMGEGVFRNCISLKNVVLSESLSVIPFETFMGAVALETVEMPKALTEISDYAFTGTKSLKSIYIPSAVTYIGYYAFDGCESLESLTFAPDIKLAELGADPTEEVAIFRNTKSLKSLALPESLTMIGASIFENSGIETLELPVGLSTISDKAFAGCDNLVDVTIYSSVSSIGERAFANCSNLENLTISFGVESIGSFAFENCVNLKGAYIPETVSYIGENPFTSCQSLEFFELDANNPYYSMVGGALYDANMYTLLFYPKSITEESYTVPDTVKVIGGGAFSGAGVKHVTLNDRIEVIPESAFKNAKSLESVNIPASVYEIKDYAFEGCSSLKEISIPASVTLIGSYVFAECDSLENVVYEERIDWVDIGSHMFYGCENITELILPPDYDYIPEYMFSGTGIVNLVIPDSVYDFSANGIFENCQKLETIKFPSYYYDEEFENPFIDESGYETTFALGMRTFANCTSLKSVEFPNGFIGMGNINWEVDEDWNYLLGETFRGCTSLETVVIPKSVNNWYGLGIGTYAFADCTSLKNIVIEYGDWIDCVGWYEGIGYFETGVFQNCTSLETFTLPMCVDGITDYMFDGCTSLREVIFESEEVYYIAPYAFRNCTSLQSFNAVTLYEIYENAFENCTALESINIEAMDAIYAYAFKNCPTKEIHIGYVYYVEAYAFDGCTADQTVFLYGVTEEELIQNALDWWGGEEGHYDVTTNTEINIIFADMMEGEEGSEEG